MAERRSGSGEDSDAVGADDGPDPLSRTVERPHDTSGLDGKQGAPSAHGGRRAQQAYQGARGCTPVPPLLHAVWAQRSRPLSVARLAADGADPVPTAAAPIIVPARFPCTDSARFARRLWGNLFAVEPTGVVWPRGRTQSIG